MNGFAGIIAKNGRTVESKIKRLQDYYGGELNPSFQLTINEKKSAAFANWPSKRSPLEKTAGADYAILFDGCLYNKVALYQALIKEGVAVTNQNETTLLLAAFVQWGEAALTKFNGDFVGAIWDEKQAKLHLFNDQIGHQSLYYYWDAEYFYFSNELKAIRPFIKADSWSELAIQHYFRLGYIPAPYTIYQQVYKLESANYLTVDFDLINRTNYKIEPHCYWSLEAQVQKETQQDEKGAKANLKQLLNESVQRRLQDKSTVGTFLSGGIDSSLVTAVAQSQKEQPIPTFSVAIKDNKHDESQYAKAIAKHLGTKHHTLTFDHQFVKTHFYQLANWYEQPFADASAFPSYLLAQTTRQTVSHALTGDGGDEQFLGYGSYTWADRLAITKNSKTFLKLILRASPKSNHQRASHYFDYPTNDHLPTHLFSVEQGLFHSKDLKTKFRFQQEYMPLQLEKTARRLWVSEKQALFDLKYYLPGDLTVKVARASANNQLTTHAPLLDPQLITWSLNLDHKLKRKAGMNKYLLQQVLFDHVPKALFERPKWGFGIPLHLWLKNELRFLLDEFVNATKLEAFPFYNGAEILKIKEDFLNGKDFLARQLWLIIVFNAWADQNRST